MIAPESTLIVLLAILTLGLLIPEIFKKFHLPFVALVILAGSIMGPNGLDYIPHNEIISFFGFLGMTFLMLMSGLETRTSSINKSKSKIFTMAFINGAIPFATGFLISLLFGYGILVSLIIGTVFISSSIAIIVSSLKSSKIFESESGQMMFASVLITDITSLVILGIIFQGISPIVDLPFQFYIIILAAIIGALFFLTPPIARYLLRRFSKESEYETQLRFVIIFAIGSLILFSWLGVHPILAAFLVGLSLSRTLPKNRSKIIDAKLHTLGYGLFVPVFFFIIGMEMDLKLLARFDAGNFLMISIISGLIISKVASGYLGARIAKLSKKSSITFGLATITQLTTTLAVTYAASTLGLLDSLLVTSIIIMSIITTFLGPLAVNLISEKRK